MSAACAASGAAALVYGAFEGVGSESSALEVKDIIRLSSNPAEALRGKVAWGSKLDAEAAIQARPFAVCQLASSLCLVASWLAKAASPRRDAPGSLLSPTYSLAVEAAGCLDGSPRV